MQVCKLEYWRTIPIHLIWLLIDYSSKRISRSLKLPWQPLSSDHSSNEIVGNLCCNMFWFEISSWHPSGIWVQGDHCFIRIHVLVHYTCTEHFRGICLLSSNIHWTCSPVQPRLITLLNWCWNSTCTYVWNLLYKTTCRWKQYLTACLW